MAVAIRAMLSKLTAPMPKSADPPLTQPFVFQPIFMERLWGGRRLETLYDKRIPAGTRVGESWEIVDRPEAQSVVQNGPLRGLTLHNLWLEHRKEIFGEVVDAKRFPLLIKILDAQEKLSLQVHPPPSVAADLGTEAKTEFWYVTDAADSAEIYVGMKKQTSRREIEEALETGTVKEHLHRISIRAGDAMFLPSGRLHAIGAGTVIIEIQQNSDTTYRVFDWDRCDAEGNRRGLHIKEALQSINFEDYEPKLVQPEGESLVRHSIFEVEKWTLSKERAVSSEGTLAIVGCLSGELSCAGVALKPGEFFLVPANLRDRELRPQADKTSLLRVTIPD